MSKNIINIKDITLRGIALQDQIRKSFRIKAIASNKGKAIIGLSLFLTISLITAGVFTSFFVPGNALADTSLSVTLDGGTSTTVLPSASVSVSATATISGSDKWHAYKYSIGATVFSCVEITHHDSPGTYTENFTVTAPLNIGSYDFSLTTYKDKDCKKSTQITTLENGIVVIAPDTTPPTVGVSGAPDDWTNSDQTAKVTCDDGSGSGCDNTSLKIYISTTDPGTCSTTYSDYTSDYTLTSPQTISFHLWVCGAAKDNAGNEGYSSPVEFKVDKNAPTTNYTATFLDNGEPVDVNVWTNRNYKIVINCSDLESGCFKNYYCNNPTNDCTNWEEEDASSPYDHTCTEGNGYFRFYSVDNVGNASEIQSIFIKIDLTPPVLRFDDDVQAGPVMADNIAINYGDATVKKYGFVSSDGDCVPSVDISGFSDYVGNFVINDDSQNGNYICVYGEDHAGNKSVLASANPLNVDPTVPAIVISNPDTNPAQSKTIEASTNLAGEFSMSEDSGGVCNNSLTFVHYAPITYTSEADKGKTVCYKVVDEQGNEAYEISLPIGGIDTTAPTLTVNEGTNAGPVKTDTINVSISEPVKLSEYGFSSDNTCDESDVYGNPFSSDVDFVIEGDHTEYLCIKAVDLANNTKYELIGQLNTDNTAPTLTEKTPVTTPTNDTTPDYTFTSSEAGSITYGGDCSGSITSAIAGDNTVTFDALSEGVHDTCTITVTDAAGNTSAPLTITPFTVDVTPPVITLIGNATVNLTVGDSYTDAGATASDNIDGDITSKITTVNPVNTAVAGDYTVTYNVTDTAGNAAAEVTRLVRVVNPPATTGGGGGGGGGGYFVAPEATLIISNLNSPNITPNTITLTWVTNFPASSYVVYSAEGEPHDLNMSDNTGNPPLFGYAHATPELDTEPKVTSHSVTISELIPLTTYYFRTVSRGSLAISGEYKFTTPAVAGVQTESNKEKESSGQKTANEVAMIRNQESARTEQVGAISTTEAEGQTTAKVGTANEEELTNQAASSTGGINKERNPYIAALLWVYPGNFWTILIIFTVLILGYILYRYINNKKK